jgi:integrase
LPAHLHLACRGYDRAGTDSRTLAARTQTWKGVRRRLGVAPDQKHPVTASDIRSMIDQLPPCLLGLRDRALITLGFAGGFRRSELVALDAADLAFVSEGL